MILALIILPVVCGMLVFLPGVGKYSRFFLLAAALLHFLLTASVWGMSLPLELDGGWLALDSLSLLFLSICSGLFLAASIYTLAYIGPEKRLPVHDLLHGFHFSNQPDRVFIGCLLFFLASMTAVTVSHHLGVLWIAVEATTLSSTPLIYYHRHNRSLEAAWKYLLICSVGIAIALLGNFFLAVAASSGEGKEISMLVPELVRHATELSPDWLKAAFLLMLVGYGTKMGLAPMHTWLPDAHSEAPSPVSALLSGALLNCAFLAIIRIQSVNEAAGLGDFGREMLVIFGLISMMWAAMLLISQTDYKRMLAYSSVEHMGILALGIGIGGVATAGALLHAVNHSLAKAALFMVAGSILTACRSKDVGEVRGLLRVLPASGGLWVAGILAITGTPPFGIFTSELMILKGALANSEWFVAAAYLLGLAIVFAAMIWTLLRMAYSRNGAEDSVVSHEHSSAVSDAVPALLLAFLLLLGLWIPAPLWNLINDAAASIGGTF